MTDANKAGTELGPAKTIPKHPGKLPTGPLGVPTPLDKLYLVWSGMFKSKEDIPKQLELAKNLPKYGYLGDVIHRARSWGRIRMNIGFLFLAAFGAGVMVYTGKKMAARGESVEKWNLEWHRKIKEDYEKSLENAKK